MAQDNTEKKPADPSDVALAKDWGERVVKAAAFWKSRFDRMGADQQFVRGKQWPGTEPESLENKRYVANITKRNINQRVSAIYAKNPKFVARRRPRLDFKLWDGNPESLAAATQGIANAMQGMGELQQQDIMLLKDIEEGQMRKHMLDKIAKTLEIVFTHQLSEPIPNFKTRFKKTVRRCKTTGVGFVKLGYQRILEHKPEISEQINDDSRKIAGLEALAGKVAEGQAFEGEKELAQLRIGLQGLQASEKIVAKEGLVFGFPKSRDIIVDIETESINGFIGSRFVAERHDYSQDQVKQYFGIDMTTCTYTKYAKDQDGKRAEAKAGGDKDSLARVYEIYDLEKMQCLWVMEGYEGFLKPPGEPDVWLEQFHPYFALVTNDIDDDDDPYPDSDVHDLRPMQMEHNRSREGLRDHRMANRPAWLGPKGYFKEEEKNKLSTHAVAEFIELENFSPTDETDLSKKIQSKPVQPIDPAMYDTDPIFQDVLRVSGEQEANMGGTTGATATESSIAENSRSSGLSSEVDEVDEFLSMLARAGGQLLLMEMSPETVKKIAGAGAVWPEHSRQEIADEIYLEIMAGSSGRPNRQLRAMAIERTGQLLVQVPGIKPKMLAQEVVQSIDETANVDDWIDEMLPSITAMNAQAQPQTGDPATSPESQGQEGGNKQARPDKPQGAPPNMNPAPAGPAIMG